MKATPATMVAMALVAGAAVPAVAQDDPAPIAAWSRTRSLDENSGELAERGAAVFNNWCSACHGRDLRNAPGTRSLEFKYRDELPAALEDRTDLTAELLEYYVRQGIATMPFYRKTELSDDAVEALAAYLVSAD